MLQPSVDCALLKFSIIDNRPVRIAYLEDDPAQSELIQNWLVADGHHCKHESNGKVFMKMLAHDTFDLLIIDWELPDISGIEVLHWLRSNIDWPIPVLFATSRNNEENIVEALESGADDYMTKPLRRSELLARIYALGRRTQLNKNQSKITDLGIYQVDEQLQTIKRSDQLVPLTGKEYELAIFLFRNSGRLISRSHIMEAVWGHTSELNTRTVDTHLSRIRKKLQLGPASGWKLSTVYQHGYRLQKTAHK